VSCAYNVSCHLILNVAELEVNAVIKILIVEDHSKTKAGLKTVLTSSHDFNVIDEADNGNDAITKAGKLGPDVILMGVGMPVMDGIEASKQILAKHPSTKIIMLAQHDDDTDILASFAASASGYCLTDVAPEKLCAAIRSVHSGDTWLEAGVAEHILKHYTAQGTLLPRASSAPTTAPNKPAPPTMEFVKPTVDTLAPRDLEVLRLIVDGLSNQETADKLTISKAAVKTIIDSVLNKLAIDHRTQSAVQTMRQP
jgi:DNA-binding NarL/FixJ family response regulator